MIVALYIFLALTIVGTILYVIHRIQGNDNTSVNNDNEDSNGKSVKDECCGMHITCERDSFLSSVSTEVVYYDDEELDEYRGTAADEYSESAVEEFRNVLLTLLPHDIAGWARSLQLRGIELPNEVRDELLMIVSEARKNVTR